MAGAQDTLHLSSPTATAGGVLAILAGLLLLAGLWTPIAGAVMAAIGTWSAVTGVEDPLASVLLATIGAALALVGPGRWSIDARLFGWRRIEIPERKK